VITIVLDPYNYGVETSPVLQVETEKDYVESRISIRKMIREGNEGTFIVKNRNICGWYKSLSDYKEVKIRSVSPKSVLINKLGCSESLLLDFPLAEQQIVGLNLLEKAKIAPPCYKLQTPRDMEMWILAVTIGECWGERDASLSHFAELVNWHLGVRKQEVASELKPLIDKQKRSWCSSEIGELYDWFFKAPDSNAFLCCVHKILVNYPEDLRNQVLNEADVGECSSSILQYIKRMPTVERHESFERRSEISTLLERKWKGHLRNLKKNMSSNRGQQDPYIMFHGMAVSALRSMSGFNEGEMNAITHFCKEHAELVTKDVVERIEVRFGGLSSQAKQTIRELKSIVPLQRPRELKLDWDWEAVAEWTVKEYFPFARWATKVGKQKETEEYAILFGEWLYKAYPLLKNDLAPLVYGTWNTVKGYISHNAKVLWLIIDNLCWCYADAFISAFRDQSIFISETAAKLSMLPSETRVSKSALIGGKLPFQLAFSDYEKLLKQCCKEHGIQPARLISDRELIDGKIDESQLTACIINKLDISCHSGCYDLKEEIHDAIKRLAKHVRSFIEREEMSTANLKIVVSTDHGSCEIPQDKKGVKKPSNSMEEERFRRYVFVSDPSDLGNEWFFLEKDRFGLNESLAIVKGYGFVGHRRPNGMVHGGMTPEEVFIPHMEFCLEPPEFEEVRLSYAGEPIPLGAKEHLVAINVINANKVPVFDVVIDIPSHSLHFEIDKIPGRDEHILSNVKLLLPKSGTDVDDHNVARLCGRYVLTYRDEKRYGEVDLSIMVRRIFERPERPEKLFGL
jgi:hypothetical protein